MRRKHYTQLLTSQSKINRSKQIASARVKQSARDGDMAALHESISRGWKLEHQAQSLRAELFTQRQQRQQPEHSLPTVLDDSQVTLRHDDSVRVVRFSSLLATDVSIGLVGLDTPLGQALHGAELMSTVCLPTPLGDKPYQIVGIHKIRLKISRNQMQDATVRNDDNDMSAASGPADRPQHSRPRQRPSER